MSTPWKLSSAPVAAKEAAAVDHAEVLSDLFRDFQVALPAATLLRRDEPLAARTTLRVGGPADIYVEPSSENALASVLELCRLRNLPVFLLGRGSNLLVRDGGIRGVVVRLSQADFSQIEIEGDRVRAGAGAKLKDIANAARRAGVAGLEFLEGIPGSLGGALRMNAGAMGGWTLERVTQLRCVSPLGEIRELPIAEVPFTYRSCPLLTTHIALGATLRGSNETAEAVKTRMDGYSQKRWDSQPNQPSAGCTFKNPAPDLPAGKLIDQLGLKGTRVGDAMVSDVHANFFVNLGSATARNVLDLIELVRVRAREAHGVELETEVEIVGEDE
jgi:UDP-N-acetylenolpyruvoylglucosamine reductase